MCGWMSDLVICKFRKSLFIHDTECPYGDQVSLNNPQKGLKSLMDEWLEQASQWHEMCCHDLEVMSSNPGWVELRVRSTSVLSRTWSQDNKCVRYFVCTHTDPCRRIKLAICYHQIDCHWASIMSDLAKCKVSKYVGMVEVCPLLSALFLGSVHTCAALLIINIWPK